MAPWEATTPRTAICKGTVVKARADTTTAASAEPAAARMMGCPGPARSPHHHRAPPPGPRSPRRRGPPGTGRADSSRGSGWRRRTTAGGGSTRSASWRGRRPRTRPATRRRPAAPAAVSSGRETPWANPCSTRVTRPCPSATSGWAKGRKVPRAQAPGCHTMKGRLTARKTATTRPDSSPSAAAAGDRLARLDEHAEEEERDAEPRRLLDRAGQPEGDRAHPAHQAGAPAEREAVPPPDGQDQEGKEGGVGPARAEDGGEDGHGQQQAPEPPQ